MARGPGAGSPGGAGGYSPAGLNGRVTQAEVDALEDGLNQTLAAIENNLVQEVLAETYPLVGKNFHVAWSNQVPAFRYLTTLRTAVVAGLGSLTGSADYASSNVASVINTRLASAGFNASSALVTTLNDNAQIAFTTSGTFATNVPIALDFGVPNLDLRLLGATNCHVAVTAAFNFTTGVDGSGFYLETASTFSFNTTSTISNLSTAARFVRLPYTLTDVTSNRTSVPLNFAITLKDPGNDGRVRLGELGGSPDLLDATVTGNTRMSCALLSSVPASALLPQVGTDLELLWNFTNAPVNPNDSNATFGHQPALTLQHNRLNLHSFFNSFANQALDEIADTTEPLQELIDVLTAEIPLLSDLGNDAVTILDVLGVPPETVAAIGALADLVSLANLASSYTNNQNVIVDLGNFTLQAGDLRVEKLEDITGSLSLPPSATLDADLVNFKAAAAAIYGLTFPLLDDPLVMAKVLLGRPGTLFAWTSPVAEFDVNFQQFFPVFGPVGVTLGGLVGLKTQFGFGYDTQGIFDFYAGGANNPDLFLNGFYAIAADNQGNPVTGITLSAGITAGVEANIVVASVGVEGDVTATISMYLDAQLGIGDGKVRGYTLLNTPFTQWFDAAGSLSAGLHAYLEIGWPPFGLAFEFDSPRVILINFDSRDNTVPVLAEPGLADLSRLVLNVGDRAHLRLHGDLTDRAEEFKIASGLQGLVVGAFGETNTFTDPFTQIVANSGLRGDLLEVQPDVMIPVLFTGGPGRDLLTGGGAADELNGGDGPDKLRGQGGDDILRGQEDNDELIGGPGANTLDGGPGNDTASWADADIPLVLDLRTGFFGGAAVSDTLISIERYKGTPFGDAMDGSDGPDQLLRGLKGNDVISGHGGDDLLEGDAGADTLLGGPGNDMINGGPGADTMDGGPGMDTLSYLAPGIPGLTPGLVGEPVTINLLTGLGTRGHANGDVVSNFEVLIGSGVPQGVTVPAVTGDDLTGSDNADTIHGMGGADIIRGGGGNDVLYGDNNIVPTEYPAEVAPLMAGFDADTIYGDAGDDQLFGQTDNDKLYGGADNDMLDGGLGDDQLDGGPGQDTLAGGEGNDYLLTFDLLSVDYLDGGPGTNRLSADYSDKNVPLVFIVGTNNAFIFPDGDQFTNMHTLGTLRTGSSNDVIRLAAAKENVRWNKNIDAGPGDDLVIADWRGFYGTIPLRSADTLAGGDGNDTLSFEQSIGGVTVHLHTGAVGGSASNLTISGFENVVGTPFIDNLSGDAGPNIFMPLRGGWDPNNDYIQGGDGEDTLRIDYSNDERVNAEGISMDHNATFGYEGIALGPNYDDGRYRRLHYYHSIERFEITGGATNDSIYGEDVFGSYPDRFIGLGGNDLLNSRSGDDYLDGGEGNDTLLPGAGNDTVLGGPGNDVITLLYHDYWLAAYGTDTVDAGPGDDVVTDIDSEGYDVTSANGSTLFRFDGGDGVDTISGDFGNAVAPIIFDEANPTDFDLPNGGFVRNFERFGAVTTGSGNDVIILHGRFNNTISLRGGNDILNPGLGIDTVRAGPGNNTVILDYSVGDDADTGGVTVVFGLERRRISTGALLDEISIWDFQRLHFTGTSKADTVTGLNGDDQFFGGAGNDNLTSLEGNDWIDGGPGADTMLGHGGNDTLIVDDAGDVVTEFEGWGGTDTVRAAINYTLPVNVEHLVLTGGALNGTGNSVSNQITGNAGNNYLRGEGDNDNLNGGGGAREIDRLNGGANADTFVLGDAGVRFYDDNSPATSGLDGYAIIEDFTPSQSDRLRLAGNAAQYFLGVSPIVAVPGTALYHDSNGNAALDPATDELIAILVSPETLTAANTISNASYTQAVDPALIGLSPLQAIVVNDGAGPRLAVEFSTFEPMTTGVLLEIQASSDLGVVDPWLTIASKHGSGAWSGLAAVSVSSSSNGRVTVIVPDLQPLAQRPRQFFRARLSSP